MQKRPKNEQVPAVTACVPPRVEAATGTSKDYGFEEFKLIAEQGRNYFDYYLRAVALYGATLGVTLKFFFDAPPWSNERLSIFSFGVAINLGAIVCTALGLRWYKPLVQRGAELSRLLGVADIHLPGPYKMGKAFLVLIVLSTLSWGVLVFMLGTGLSKAS